MWFEQFPELDSISHGADVVGQSVPGGRARMWERPLTEHVLACPLKQRRRNGGGDAGARPRNVETTGAIVSFRTRNIFPHFCVLFLKLPLFVVMLMPFSSFFTNKIHTATENFNKKHTHAYPSHKACLSRKQDGKLLRVLWQAAINKNSAKA